MIYKVISEYFGDFNKVLNGNFFEDEDKKFIETYSSFIKPYVNDNFEIDIKYISELNTLLSTISSNKVSKLINQSKFNMCTPFTVEVCPFCHLLILRDIKGL